MLTLQESIDDLRAKFASFISGGESKANELNTKVADLTKAQEASASKIGQLESDLATAKQTIGTLTKERDEAKASADSKDAEISTLKASQTDFDKAVADKSTQLLASNGVPVSELPASGASSGTEAEQIEALQKRLETETDPEKNYALAKQLTELKFGKPKGK
jgi:chromosome segregation ATPase